MDTKGNRSLFCAFLYYIFSGLYFIIHLRDAAQPFLSQGMDCALILLGIIICFAGFFRSNDSCTFLTKGLKCFAFCDGFSILLQYLYGKEVPIFYLWMNIIIKVFIVIVLFRRMLDHLADIYWKNGSKRKSVKYRMKKLRLGLFYLISPAILYYIYIPEFGRSNYKLTYVYIFLCYFIVLIQFIRFLRESLTGYVNSLSPEEEPDTQNWLIRWEWDRYNPISMIDRALTAFIEILFGQKRKRNIIISVSVAIILLTVICNVIYVGGKYRIDNPQTEELSRVTSSQAINANPCIRCSEVKDGSLKIYRYTRDNLTPINSKIHKVKYGIVSDDGVDSGAKYPVLVVYKQGLAEDGLGHLIDYHGNVILKLPKIATTRISAKTNFYRDLFSYRRNRMAFNTGIQRDRVAEVELDKLMSDKGTAVFYSEVLDSYGMCNKEGEILVKPNLFDFWTLDMESDKICMFKNVEERYIYNYDGKVITGNVLDSHYSDIDFENVYELDCIIYCYDNTRTKTGDDNEHDYLRVVDYEGNIIADNIINCQKMNSKDNKFLLTMEDNKQYIFTGSDGKPIIIDKEGKNQ